MGDFSSGGDRHTPEDDITKPFAPAQPLDLATVKPYKERVDELMKVSALTDQVGGSHYKNMVIQPVEYMMANGIGFMEGSVIKYVSRWRDKGGLEDLRKARHFLDLLIENEEK